MNDVISSQRIASTPDLASTAAPDRSRLDVMNFLNEVAGRFPQAISFASGRPAESFFDVKDYPDRLPEFVRHLQATRGTSYEAAFNLLAQYGNTGGLINDLVA